MQKFKVNGLLIPKIKWKQTDGGQTDGGDCITFLANAVGNKTAKSHQLTPNVTAEWEYVGHATAHVSCDCQLYSEYLPIWSVSCLSTQRQSIKRVGLYHSHTHTCYFVRPVYYWPV